MTGDGLVDVDPVASTGSTLTCEKCGHDFEHLKSGRKPKRCPDCRATSSTAREAAPRRPKSVEQLKSNIQQQLALLGMALTFVDPFDAQVILKNAEEGAAALANLAATNDSIRRTLEKGAELAGWGPVLLWIAKMSVPMLAHHGLIRGVADPAKAPAQSNGKSPGPFGPFDGVAL